MNYTYGSLTCSGYVFQECIQFSRAFLYLWLFCQISWDWVWHDLGALLSGEQMRINFWLTVCSIRVGYLTLPGANYLKGTQRSNIISTEASWTGHSCTNSRYSVQWLGYLPSILLVLIRLDLKFMLGFWPFDFNIFFYFEKVERCHSAKKAGSIKDGRLRTYRFGTPKFTN